MSIKDISNRVTSKVGRQLLTTRKNSPALLFGVGVVGFATTVVLATRATLKVDEVLKEAEENNKKIKEAEELSDKTDGEYTEEEKKRDQLLVRTRAAVALGKLYAPAVGVGVLSIGCLSGSHMILSRRNAAITAAYAVLDKGFREYRGRVVNEYGQEKDREFRFGVAEREIAVDTDEGVAVKTIRGIDQEGLKKGGSIYARFFDEYSKNWSKDPGYNQMFLQSQQNYANDKLKARGHVFLNEIYDMLGLERSKEGAVVGWVRGNGDDYIDFGVFRNDSYMGDLFVNGNERSVLLDFNVDGVIYDKI